MATNKRGTSSNRGGSRKGRTNNPEGRNQYSGMMGTARQNPIATAAAVGGAVAAGLFLWSRRDLISDQLGNLSDKAMGSDRPATTSGGDNRTQVEIAEEALTLKETGQSA